ncbi:uncharacterized protein BDR25DRAFT_334001 [Lindgomyces ingoldianus]|uniref:Uncharacterized protein n=1 Tax=Lindgomyces ingoldianus TaxID=673940 RepID=A0ACB6QZ60_9PLEO|nr:uncharacterized protein BDR25DRAFT_334001 [Lindgomyces ingoldianus]KAF2471382.1 hypothetical protein BDR25DRAFT_334001 [Lindgomyces ingoldianus]
MLQTWIPRLGTLFTLTSLLAIVSAQSSSETITARATLSSTGAAPSPTSSATNSTTSRGPKVFTVKVGAGEFAYNPANLSDVHVGDTVSFEFYPLDHSVARAEFGSACVPYEYTGKNKVGFYSGTENVTTVNDLKYWNLTINDTAPIFYYCTAPGSCKDHQMVGVINPNATQTLDDQIESAKEAKFMVAPGQPLPGEASSSLSVPSSTSTSSPTSTPVPTHSSHHSNLSGGAIAGIAVGAAAFLVICAALFFYIGRTKSLKEVLDRRDATVTKTTPMTAGTEFGTPGTPGYPSQLSPQAEYSTHPPTYGQHHATETHPSGWTSPQMHPGHMSMTPPPPPQMAEVKSQHAPVEMHSPTPMQQTFPHELEAPIKSPR